MPSWRQVQADLAAGGLGRVAYKARKARALTDRISETQSGYLVMLVKDAEAAVSAVLALVEASDA